MKNSYMIIDINRCENCNNCFLACKDEHCGNDWPGYTRSQPLHGHRWMEIHTRERGTFPCPDVVYLPQPCLHCQQAPCIASAPTGAIVRRPDGIVCIEPHRAGELQDVGALCPYGAMWWNDELKMAQKCTLCAHLLDQGWQTPRCVQACPTGAMQFQRLGATELQALIRSANLQALPGMGHTGQHLVLYKNLERYYQCFIAGTVVQRSNGIEDCVSGATVTLLHGGRRVATLTSDIFGDYRFDGLAEDSGAYNIQASKDEQESRPLEVHLGRSCYAGISCLESV